jgi:acyl dehydratase
MPVEFDRENLGKEFDRRVCDPVSAQALIAFAQALGETNPRYVEDGPDLVAHPTYCVSIRGRRFFPEQLPAGLDLRASFDAGKDVEIGEPIRPGDVITCVTTLHDVYEKTGRSGSMVFLVVRFSLTNQRDEQVAVVDNRIMFRGAA